MDRVSDKNNTRKKIQPGRSPEARGALFQNCLSKEGGILSELEQSKVAGNVNLDTGRASSVHTEKECSVHTEKECSMHTEKECSVHTEKECSVHTEKECLACPDIHGLLPSP